MKKIAFYFLALAATTALVFSCNKEVDPAGEEIPAGSDFVFTASIEGAIGKTTVENGEGTERIVKWAAGDQISVWWGEGEEDHTTASAADAGTSTTFTPAITITPGTADYYYAAYPAGSAKAFALGVGESPSTMTIVVPSTQAGTFAAANIAVSKTSDADRDFNFANLTALVKFSVSGSTYTKAVFRGAKGETLAGTVPVDMSGAPTLGPVSSPAKEIVVDLNGAGEYYISVLPCTLEGGFSISLYEGTTTAPAAYLPVSMELARGTITNLGKLDGRSITNYFVTPTGAGKKNGKNWDNALGTAELKALIKQPVDEDGKQINAEAYNKAAILDGVTFHMAEGEYYLAAGETEGRVKMEFQGYSKQVAITFRGGYPTGRTGTDISDWTMPTAVTSAPTNCTAFTGNNEAGIFVLGNQTDITFQGITFKNGNFSSANGVINASAGNSGNCKLVVTNCRFVDNDNNLVLENGTRKYSGAGIILYKVDATISNCYFGGNKSRNAAALFLPDKGLGAVVISGCIFEGNNTDNTSGAFQNASPKRSVTLNDCVFSGNNAASWGGAFHCNGDEVLTTFNRCDFSNNTAKQGGAISIQMGKNIFNNCKFEGNIATQGDQTPPASDRNGKEDNATIDHAAGGAIMLRNAESDCTLNNCTFVKNKATNGNGGAISFLNKASKLIINAGTSFTDNTAYQFGGAIFALGGGFTISGNSSERVSFIRCKTLSTTTANANGGAIWVGSSTTSSMEYAYFEGCEAGQEDGSTVNYSNGGAIRMRAVTSFQASNCEFTDNRGRNGMCVSLELGSSSTCKFKDCNFHDNIGRSGASKDGTNGNFHGGVAQLGDNGTVEFEGCSFTDNVAYHGSGAIHQNGKNTTVNCKNCTFTHNTALDGNGGCATIESTGTMNLEGCTFTNNSVAATSSTRRDGGVFYMNVAGSALTAKGCTFTGNTITGAGDKNPYGGVLRVGYGSDISFTDCVFDGNGNSVVYSGGCISLNQDAHLKLDNCLFKNNVSKTRGVLQAGANALIYMNNVTFYNNTTTGSGGWGVNAHTGNANVCMNNVTSIGNHCTAASPGNCASFTGDGGWLVVNSTIIDSTPTAVVRRGGSNGRYAIFCNDVLINTHTAKNSWAMNQATKFVSKGHNVLSTSGTYNNAAPDANDLLSQTTLPSGAYSEHWNATPHYAVYTWTGSLSGFSAATQSDVTAAIEAYTETDSIHTEITSIGADFKLWLEGLSSGYAADGRGTARTGTWWPGAYQQN